MNEPPPGRLAGIDYGTVRIGIALTDRDQQFASPYENYDRRDPQADAQRFERLVKEEAIVQFVVGLPVHTHGGESQKSKEACDFGAWLKEVTSVPVTFYDERYSSFEAEQMLQDAQFTKKRRKQRLDMLAAQIMLAAYLESDRDGEHKPRDLADH